MKLKILISSVLLLAAQAATAAHIEYACGGDCPVAIADASTTTSTINIAATGSIADINIFVDLDHTFDGDLDIFIGHNGTEVQLFNQDGSVGDDLTAYFDDEGTAGSIDLFDPPYTECLLANGGCTADSSPDLGFGNLLSAFDGMDLSGDWTLRIVDNFGADIGTLQDWSVFAVADAAPAPAPEPGILLLLGMGLAGLGFARRR